MGMSYSCWKQHIAAQKYAEGLRKKREREREKNMPWFLTEFLPSVASRIGKNPQYPNSCIVSDRQAYVLRLYMETDESDSIEVDNIIYSLETRGKWYVLVRRVK